MRNTVLKEMDKCSGCGLCETVCPAQAIKMEYDKSGFIYPVIQKCSKSCSIQCVQQKVSDTIKFILGISYD